jgi:hypothetical protein
MLHPGQEVRPLRPIVVQHLSFMHVETVQAGVSVTAANTQEH